MIEEVCAAAGTPPRRLLDAVFGPDASGPKDLAIILFRARFGDHIPLIRRQDVGSVSTLAPLFAAAFATRLSWPTFLVGLAAAIGAGISMGFAEALSDNGSLTGRGSPWLRGLVCGVMTTIGGLGHALPFLIPEFWTATTIAGAVVLVELSVIAWVRNHYMDTPLLTAAFQVVVGGLCLFLRPAS